MRWWSGSIILVTLTIVAGLPDRSEGRRELMTQDEKAQLKAAQEIHLETVAITDKGRTDAAIVTKAAEARLKGMGYDVTTDESQPHDVTVKVKCEEHKVWEGTVTSGGDADQLNPASRLWKGPACQITYRTATAKPSWRHEVRGVLPSGQEGKTPTIKGQDVIAHLAARLGDDPFPLLLAGAWQQSSRLMKALDDPASTTAEQTTAINLLGNMFAAEAIPTLNRKLQDKDPAVVRSAAIALGAIGHSDCIPPLLNLLKDNDQAARVAAIKGLGKLAPLHPNSDIVPILLSQLPKEPVQTQTEIVLALAKTTDRRILEPLRELNRSVQVKVRSESGPEWKELKRVLGESLDSFDGPHTEE
ncbi:HEAT repeat domain-containing protein [Petrachloros mirabilis]